MTWLSSLTRSQPLSGPGDGHLHLTGQHVVLQTVQADAWLGMCVLGFPASTVEALGAAAWGRVPGVSGTCYSPAPLFSGMPLFPDPPNHTERLRSFTCPALTSAAHILKGE